MRIFFIATIVLLATTARDTTAISIVLDFTLDAHNENWFDPQSPEGLARRNSVNAAATFLSSIIVNDDWQGLATLNESFTLSDIAASTIYGLDGSLLVGTAESDGAGYTYASSGNDIDTSNRSSVGANEFIVYVGAFAFDAGTTANAKGAWDSNDRRNAAGFAGEEFNTWGGDIYFNTTKNWYAGSNPGVDPTDDYGIQDSNKRPTSDISTDNWDWSTVSDTWKGFQLNTIDSSANGKFDLYATAVHELMHALGATTSNLEEYVGVDANGDFVGPNLTQVYGAPVPGDGGHFAENVQSLVWASEDIVSEAVLDPNSLSGVRKYFTQLDAALLRDLGYEILHEFPSDLLAGDYEGNGSVDAADYTVWRDHLGSTTVLPNDPSAGLVTQDDFDTWKSHFGQTAGGGSGTRTSAPVPEPAVQVLLGLAAAGGGSRRSRAAWATPGARL